MHPRFSITVNGRRRRSLLLAASQPIPNLDFLSLEVEDRRSPHFRSSRHDYRRGAYRFSASLVQIGRPGTYRPHAVAINYTDGTSAQSPLLDEVVIEVAAIPKRPEHLPLFTAR